MEIRVGDNILKPRGDIAPFHREAMPEVPHTAVPLTKHLHTCHWCGKPWDCSEAGCNLPDVVVKVRCPNRPAFSTQDTREGGVTQYASDGVAAKARAADKAWRDNKLTRGLDQYPEFLRGLILEQRKTR